MDHPSALSERKKQILKAIIDVHIRLGEPVGSKFLTQNEQIALLAADGIPSTDGIVDLKLYQWDGRS